MMQPENSSKGFKVKKLRIGFFAFSVVLCVLILSPFTYSVLTHTDTILNTMDVWSKIGYVGVLVFIGFVWIGLSFVFIINKGKCATCGISIKDDYSYCSMCDNLKQAEFRSTKEHLYCAVCDKEISSFDAFKGHYIQEHEDQQVAECIFQPPFSKIRATETVYIKKLNL